MLSERNGSRSLECVHGEMSAEIKWPFAGIKACQGAALVSWGLKGPFEEQKGLTIVGSFMHEGGIPRECL